MHTVTLPDGERVPALGLGTWRMGESQRSRDAEVAAVRTALDLGYRLIDTAEMYGDGGAETVVGTAVSAALNEGQIARKDLFIVSKVYPHNASRKGAVEACERSLKRLQIDQLDLYLLHWRGSHPLRETVAAFEALKAQGRIRHWGVSNFDTNDMQELMGVEHGKLCAANQVYYSLGERGIEFDLLPWLQGHRMATMAYCPIGQGKLTRDPKLIAIAQRLGISAAQIALAWFRSKPGVIAIPKAARAEHLKENLEAADITLSDADLAELEGIFPAPEGKTPLAMT